jgi:hypothetical protein
MAKATKEMIVVYTRFPKPIADRISRLAKKERRSFAAQVEVIVEQAMSTPRPAEAEKAEPSR